MTKQKFDGPVKYAAGRDLIINLEICKYCGIDNKELNRKLITNLVIALVTVSVFYLVTYLSYDLFFAFFSAMFTLSTMIFYHRKYQKRNASPDVLPEDYDQGLL